MYFPSFVSCSVVATSVSDCLERLVSEVTLGTAGQVSNYRPISLTCVLSKIMERMLSHKIYVHLQINNILHRSQHGFCSVEEDLLLQTCLSALMTGH